jgi:hypothetical protein
MKRVSVLLLLTVLLAGGILYLFFHKRVEPILWVKTRLNRAIAEIDHSPRLREVRYSGEIPHRHNPPSPAWSNVPERQRHLSERFAIGGRLAHDEFLFIRPSDVDIDASGNVYVVDRGHRRLQVFAPDRTLLRSLRYDKGNNPYFLSPRKVAVSPAGDIRVWDDEKGLVCFDAGGRFVNRIPLPYDVSDLAVDAAGRALLLTPGEPLTLHRLLPNGDEILAFAEPTEPDTALWSVFGLGYLGLGPGDVVYCSTVYPYQITAYESSGQPVRRFSRDLNTLITPPTISRDSAGNVRSVSRQQLAFGVAVGDDSLVYSLVRTQANRGAGQLDVFSPQGEYVQVFYLPISASAFSMRGQRIVLLESPPNQRVHCYDLVSFMHEGQTLLGEARSRGYHK